MFDGKFRTPVDRAVKPMGNLLRKTGLTPDHLTILGLLVGIGAAVAIGAEHLRIGLLLVILAALPDLLDGALAKAQNTSSQRGAFFDSTVDRITDSLLLGGIAWYLASTASPHMSILPFAVAAVSSLISYQRAKAESLGIDAKGGLMERAERIIAHLRRSALRAAAHTDPVDHARPDVDHGDPTLRQGVEAGSGRSVTAARIEMRRSRRQSRRVARTERRRTRVPRRRA